MGKWRGVMALGLGLVGALALAHALGMALGDAAASQAVAAADRLPVIPRVRPPIGEVVEPEGRKYLGLVARECRAQGVDQALVHALIFAESSYDPKAVSPAGAIGLMQLMPATADRYGVKDLYNPEQNVRGGVRHLKELLAQFDGNVELAVAAYNAGPGAVARAGNRVPPIAETTRYVPRVLAHYHRLRVARVR